MKLNKFAAASLLVLVFVALAAFSKQQRDEYLNGDELLSYCESSTVSHTGTWCLGYILGVWHTTASQRQACPPVSVTAGELRSAVVRHLQQHRAALNRQPVDLVLEALGEAFPCQ